MIQSVFFAKEGEKGLNETSAAKLAAVASSLKAKNEAKLSQLSFVTTKIVGLESYQEVESEVGMTLEVAKLIPTIAFDCAELNGFIAWLAEGRKALEDAKSKINRTTLSDWATSNNLEVPTRPIREYIDAPTEAEVIASLDVKERATYLALEARSALLGKQVQPDGPFSQAVVAMWNAVAKPASVNESGRDTVIRHHSTSAEPEKVQEIFDSLQHQYQETESALNHMKSDIRKKLDERTIAYTTKVREYNLTYDEQVSAFEAKLRDLMLQYNQWQADELAKLSQTKIAIPECYTALLDKLYNVGK